MRPKSDYEQSVFVPELSCEKLSEKVIRVRLIYGGGGGQNRGVEQWERIGRWTGKGEKKLPPDYRLGSQSQR